MCPEFWGEGPPLDGPESERRRPDSLGFEPEDAFDSLLALHNEMRITEMPTVSFSLHV